MTGIPRWLNHAPAADNGPHRERSPRMPAEVPARAEPPYAVAPSLTMPLRTVRTTFLPPVSGPAYVRGFRQPAGWLPHMR